VPPTAIDTVIFDLGGVLIDWNPRHLYGRLFGDDEAGMEAFLAEVCTPEWNLEQDRGRPWAEAVEELALAHPEQRELIEAYHVRWDEMVAGAIDGTVEILSELRGRVRLLVLSNWSAETFPVALRHCPFLEWFDGIVISGEVKACKPEEAAFRALLERYSIEPGSAVFVDDSDVNVAAATKLGLIGIRFDGPAGLRRALQGVGLLESA
jgi:2-haloacid dehalogenase